MPATDDEVHYQPLGGGPPCDATIVKVHADGTVDVSIRLPGVKEPFGRTKVPWHDTPSLARGAAFPKT